MYAGEVAEAVIEAQPAAVILRWKRGTCRWEDMVVEACHSSRHTALGPWGRKERSIEQAAVEDLGSMGLEGVRKCMTAHIGKRGSI